MKLILCDSTEVTELKKLDSKTNEIEMSGIPSTSEVEPKCLEAEAIVRGYVCHRWHKTQLRLKVSIQRSLPFTWNRYTHYFAD